MDARYFNADKESTTLMLSLANFFSDYPVDQFFFANDLKKLFTLSMQKAIPLSECAIELDEVSASLSTLLNAIKQTNELDAARTEYAARLQQLKSKYLIHFNAELRTTWKSILIILQHFADKNYLLAARSNYVFYQKLQDSKDIHFKTYGSDLLKAICNSHIKRSRHIKYNKYKKNNKADGIPIIKQIFDESLMLIENPSRITAYQQFADKFVSGKSSKLDQCIGRSMQAFGIAVAFLVAPAAVGAAIFLAPLIFPSILAGGFVTVVFGWLCYKLGSNYLEQNNRKGVCQAMTLFGKTVAPDPRSQHGHKEEASAAYLRDNPKVTLLQA